MKQVRIQSQRSRNLGRTPGSLASGTDHLLAGFQPVATRSMRSLKQGRTQGSLASDTGHLLAALLPGIPLGGLRIPMRMAPTPDADMAISAGARPLFHRLFHSHSLVSVHLQGESPCRLSLSRCGAGSSLMTTNCC